MVRILDHTTGFQGLLSAIDTNTIKVVTTLPSGSNSAELAVNPTTNRFYTTDTMTGQVSVFDGQTNTHLTDISTGSVPNSASGIAVNPTTNRIYVANFSHGTDGLVVIDDATNAVLSTTALLGDATEVAVNPSDGQVYVTNGQAGTLTVLSDAATAAPTKLPGTGSPTGWLLSLALAAAALTGGGLALRRGLVVGRGPTSN
jgi:DNA-binding beta-propeller fold protein YncE